MRWRIYCAYAAPPQYQIYDIGVVDVGDTASQALACRVQELRSVGLTHRREPGIHLDPQRWARWPAKPGGTQLCRVEQR